MLKHTQREIAISAARSYLREQGIDPLICESQDALLALDDLSRLDDSLIASQWYKSMTDNQEALFRREWRQWRHSWAAVNRLARQAYKRLDAEDVNGVLESLNDLDAVLATK